MVDPNPARGMPLQLQRYWIAGKGALKIRWNVPGDFKRCVRQLRKYFPLNPEGLCNILHTKATGGPPGHGSLEVRHKLAITAAAELLAKQPQLGNTLWAGPLAPIGRPTEEPRIKRQFDPGALKHRPLPLPLNWRERDGAGHDGGVTIGRIMGMTVGPDHMGQETMWGWGDLLDPEVIPEVTKAKYLLEQGVLGASVDPGGPVVASIDPATGDQYVSEYTVGGATLVSRPAFSGMQLCLLNEEGEWAQDDDEDMVMDLIEEGDHPASVGRPNPVTIVDTATKYLPSVFTVNDHGWRGLPLAVREAPFDNDDATKRIQAWATGQNGVVDVGKLQQAFLWHDTNQPPTVTQSYRLPLGDIINGNLTLVYHAIYAAAALISGAHGGLPDVPDNEKNQLRNVISAIYPEMAKSFNDPNIRAPWDAPSIGNAAAEGFKPQPAPNAGNFSIEEGFAMADNPRAPYGDVTYADPGYQTDKKKRYPIDTAEHVRAAWSYINQADNAKAYSPDQLKQIKARIAAAAKKFGIQISEPPQMAMMTGKQAMNKSMMASSKYPVYPPASWFEDPVLPTKTGLTVTDDGHVFGHIAAWGECHRDFNECVLAPHSKMDYRAFHLGKVRTAEGETLKAGKIQMDTTHADVRLGFAAAAFHYDDTGNEVAVVRAGEDEYGIWVAGAIVPEATEQMVARLRRSPISGDWRQVEGGLELVAALAVNTPAFPVYAMEGEDRFSLVAAGVVNPPTLAVDDAGDTFAADDDDPDYEQFWAEFSATVDRYRQTGDRGELAERLNDLAGDEEIYEQRERAERFSLLAAAEGVITPQQPQMAQQAQPAQQAQQPVTPATPQQPGLQAPAAGMTPEQVAALPDEEQQMYAMFQMPRAPYTASAPEGADNTGQGSAAPPAPQPPSAQAPQQPAPPTAQTPPQQ
jgi:uncharacterized protein DUF6582